MSIELNPDIESIYLTDYETELNVLILSQIGGLLLLGFDVSIAYNLALRYEHSDDRMVLSSGHEVASRTRYLGDVVSTLDDMAAVRINREFTPGMTPSGIQKTTIRPVADREPTLITARDLAKVTYCWFGSGGASWLF